MTYRMLYGTCCLPPHVVQAEEERRRENVGGLRTCTALYTREADARGGRAGVLGLSALWRPNKGLSVFGRSPGQSHRLVSLGRRFDKR